jgi:glycosyltransferase involved in cell wall biosynthesis
VRGGGFCAGGGLRSVAVDQVRAFLKFAGKGDRKVVAVFATSAAGAGRAVRYLRRELPGVPVRLFSLEPPEASTAQMCEGITVEADSMALVVAAQRELWPYTVALSVTTWTGGRLGWPVKLAPFVVPPFRALILNRHGDFLAGTPRNVAVHVRRYWRDAAHSGWNRIKDVQRAWWLWFFALAAQRFSPLSRLAFRRCHGSQRLAVQTAAEGNGIAAFHYAHRQWNWDELDQLVRNGSSRWILFLEGGASADASEWLPLFDDRRTFAVARQTGLRDWKPCLFPIAPFRQLQQGEAAQVTGPLSDAILVDRGKLAALGVPKTIVPGTAWLLLYWKAAAAGWRSYSVGGSKELEEFPDWPYEEAEFVTRILSDPGLRALGPVEPDLGRGAVAFHLRNHQPQPASSRPTVLVVSPYLPYPLSHGGAVRIYNLCRALRDDVNLLLACFREKGEEIDYDKLREIFQEVYVVDRDERPLPEPALPKQVREHQSSSMRALITELAERVDVLQIEFTHMAAFRDAAPRLPAVLVEHDVTFTLYRQYADDLEYRRWWNFERHWLARYDAVWTMSDQDRDAAIEAGAEPARTFVVPNGVDLERFTPGGEAADPAEVLFIGSFRHRPNVIGFERLRLEIMPDVWRLYPNVRLTVVAGPEPQRYWRHRGPLDGRIRMHAFVADVRPLYARAGVVAVPLAVSAGTNIKVLEAMACAKPVVSTPAGCQGLGLVDGRDVLVRDTSSDFAAALCEMLARGGRALELGRAARATAESRFGWNSIARRALANYATLAEVAAR